MQTMRLDIIRTSTIIYDADVSIVMHYLLQTAHPTGARNLKWALHFISWKNYTIILYKDISSDLCKLHGKYMKSFTFTAHYLRVSHLTPSQWILGVWQICLFIGMKLALCWNGISKIGIYMDCFHICSQKCLRKISLMNRSILGDIYETIVITFRYRFVFTWWSYIFACFFNLILFKYRNPILLPFFML